jgi:RNA polymerase sigma-70 factor (ECF subfamily)
MNGATYRIWEQTLVVRCQAGDDDAFAELMGLYEARLRYYVEGLAGRTNDADDILQDVWLDVYLKIHKLRSPKAFRAWLYRIARDKV